MEYKSNITVASNIFARRNHDIRSDPDFVHNCRGSSALRTLDNRLFGTTVAVKLTPAQRREMSEDKGCSFALDGQMTHGAVRRGNEIGWECRCEYEACDRFNSCMPDPIVRTSGIPVASNDTVDSSLLEYEWLGAVEDIFELPEMVGIGQESADEPIPEEFAEPPQTAPGEYIVLENPNMIIQANLNARIIVNAGPGTGKTYTVIERLAYIIDAGEVDLGQVLVLCYTNAARDVILGRLDEKGLSVQARQLVICTLDSLAWNNLSSKITDDLFALGYNGCIQRFNAEFDADEWSDFEYVIIDEIQDLVNERAKMTLNIAKAVRCGYLLLGDKCQAIYDYDCDGAEKINSLNFYKQLDELLSQDSSKYELIRNRRQSKDLSQCSDNLRKVLLTSDVFETNDYFKREIESMPSETFSATKFIHLQNNGAHAILARNNGEAEWISAKLRANNVPHNLQRSVTPGVSLHRWIADMFWDYRQPRIGKEDFVERYLARVKDDVQAAENAFAGIICLLSDEPGLNIGYFDLREFSRMLNRGQDISLVLTNAPCESLTVSTIHKAKGREFDHVYLLDGFTASAGNTEEARVWYVGATRPKTELGCLRKGRWYLRKASTARWIWQGRKRYSYTYFCDRIVVGLVNDIDANGFICGNLDEALRIQAHIATQVKVNDVVELCLIDGNYEIRHKGFRIGRLSDDARLNILSSIRSLFQWSNMPPRLTDVYVGNIATVVLNRSPTGTDAMFKDSGFWLGVELTGFAKADWHWEDNNL